MAKIPKGAILVTLDMYSLYTSIPNTQAIDAILEHTRKDPEAKYPHIRLANWLQWFWTWINLSSTNSCTYKYLVHPWGLCVPHRSLVNLFMRRLEKDLLENYERKCLIWLWCVDDIFLIMTHGEESLAKFVEYANSIHPTIKFTSCHSRQSVECLDTSVQIDPRTNVHYVSLYTKLTDNRDFLHFTSVHPLSTKWGGPYGQFLRLRRIY